MPSLIVLYGLPCTGKTTISNMMLAYQQLEIIRMDDIWQATFPNPNFTIEESLIVFGELLVKVGQLKRDHQSSVLIEGVFASRTRLEQIKAIADECGLLFRSVLLFNNFDKLLELNAERNQRIKHKLSENSLLFLKNKFDSGDFCDLVIDTGNISFSKAAEIISNLICNGE